MIKLEIIENDDYANYIVKDQNENTHSININFININKPSIGTIIEIDESVLEEQVSLNYGPVKDKALELGKEIIKLSYNENEIYLQRYYG